MKIKDNTKYIGKYVHAGGELNGICGYVIDVQTENDDIFGEEDIFYVMEEDTGTVHRYSKEELQEITIGIVYKELD